MVGVVYVVGILPLMESLNLLCVDMNAKEFAHELEKAASFIRQQQAEIEALKAAKIRAYNNGVEDGRKPDTNNEPVAWMETYKGEPNNLDWDKNNLYCEGEFHNVVPLYTHPVKELTDEEIIEIGLLTTDPRFSHIESPLLLEFARAILRKAQDK